MLSILVFEIKGKNAQKIKIINNNLSLLSGRNVVSWGKAKCDFVGGIRGTWRHFPPPPACMLKKALILVLSLLTLHNVLHQYLSNYLFYTKNTKKNQKTKNDCIQWINIYNPYVDCDMCPASPIPGVLGLKSWVCR
jgi:hypothetical protein